MRSRGDALFKIGNCRERNPGIFGKSIATPSGAFSIALQVGHLAVLLVRSYSSISTSIIAGPSASVNSFYLQNSTIERKWYASSNAGKTPEHSLKRR